MKTIHYEVRDGVAVITMDRPPVNSLGHRLRVDIFDAVERSIADASIRAIVLAGNGRAFSGGADITEFGGPLPVTDPRLSSLIEQMESSPKPVVAAITGVCLGGGLELAMGAHYRVAHADASVGLPEVKLGILPGGGGTQRLPRLVGLERGLNMIVQGAVVKASTLVDTGLFDNVVDDAAGDATRATVDAAVEFARTAASSGPPYKRVRDLRVEQPLTDDVIGRARAAVASGRDKSLLLAQQKCVDSVAATLSLSFDDGLVQEREFLNILIQSPESKAARHIFMAERAAAKIPDLDVASNAHEIHRVGVVGAGTMGVGIAMSFLNAGIEVTLVEISEQALDRGLAAIARNYADSVRKARMREDQVQARMALLKSALDPALDFVALKDADLVIEAVFEEMAVKQGVFARLDAACKPDAILASNTSYLDIDTLARFTSRPEKVLGLHFFSPANVMKLLEIVRGEKTSGDVLLTCMALARRIGKIAVVARVCDGFIGNRMVARYTAAAHDLVVQGASPQQVDEALQAFGFAMGPFRMGDLAGLDIGYATRKRYRDSDPDAAVRPHIADDLVEQARLGQKAGKGWYRYEANSRDPVVDPDVRQIIEAFRRAHGIKPRDVSDREVVERCVYALVNEGARILEEGVAIRASDIDVVYLNGYGFPRQHGGPMFYADLVGLDTVSSALKGFASEPGAHAWWQPAALLESLVASDNTFHRTAPSR